MNSELAEVAADVFLCRGTEVNWLLVRDGRAVTMIDAGYPGDRDRLLVSLRTVGARREDVAAVLLTHAHVDHLGGVLALVQQHGTPVYAGPAEVAHARRDYLQQAGPRDILPNLARPGVLPWLIRAVRAGALSRAGVPRAEPFPSPGPLDLPGHPIPIPTPGHTDGHTAYLLPAVHAVASGDALITGHRVFHTSGPSVCPGFFNHADPIPALAALAALDADVLLPGHGDPVRGPVRDAVAEAVRRAEDRER